MNATITAAEIAAYTDAERDEAARWAKARSLGQYKGTGVYPVTVGGIVVGKVIKFSATMWHIVDAEGHGISTVATSRQLAVDALARTDAGVQAYREAAWEGAFGTAVERAERERREALLAALDAEYDAEQATIEPTNGPALVADGPDRWVTADQGPRYTVICVEAGSYRIGADSRPYASTYAATVREAREVIAKERILFDEVEQTTDEAEAVVTISDRAWSLLLALLGEEPRHHALRLRLIKTRKVVQRGLGEAMQLRGTRADIQEVGNVLHATANEAGRAFNQVDEVLG